MLLDLLDKISEYLKGLPFWSRIQGLVSFATLLAAVLVFGYQYIEWRFGMSPGLSLYLHSYVFLQLLVATLAFALLTLILSWRRSPPEGADSSAKRPRFAGSMRMTPRRFLALVVLAVTIPVLLALSPRHVSHIQIRFLDEPEFDRDAFTYVIYELNRLQPSWHFEVDPDPFNPNILTAEEAERCAQDPTGLTAAKLLSQGRPLIAVTSQSLGKDSFWVNQDSISVISTSGAAAYSPVTLYEYLAYEVVVQSIVIHLSARRAGLPAGAFRESRSAFGSLFQFTPRRSSMKAEILASHLTPDGQKLLMNTFGLDYMNTCTSLLGLNWLYGTRVRTNLERCFDVKLAGTGSAEN